MTGVSVGIREPWMDCSVIRYVWIERDRPDRGLGGEEGELTLLFPSF